MATTVRSSAGILLIGIVVAIMVAGLPSGGVAQRSVPAVPVATTAPKPSPIHGSGGAAEIVVSSHDLVLQLVIALVGLAAIIGIGLGVLAKLGAVTGPRPRDYYLKLD